MSESIPTIKQQLESYILSIGELDIHDFNKNTCMYSRTPNLFSLYDYDVLPVNTTLKVRRNVDTGEVIDFTEVKVEDKRVEEEESNVAVSDNNLVDCNSFDLLLDKLSDPLEQLESDFDSSLNDFLTVPPGFDYGLEFMDNGEIVETNRLETTVKEKLSRKKVQKRNVAIDFLSMIEDDTILLDKRIENGTENVLENIEMSSDSKIRNEEEESSVIPEDTLPILKISESNKVEKVIVDKWAEMISLTANLKMFDQKIPLPAHKFPFELDPFQKQAIMKLEDHENIFVAAHTSAGKTVVAEYAIALSKKHLTKTIYTSPIKALSNQKYRDFKKTFKDVGLITGDFKINDTASCVIMTTEILRSMLYRGSHMTNDLEYVIFDEVHYINDSERGHVWEEVLVLLPNHVCIIMLSATVPNAMELANWLGCIKKKKVYVITTMYRPVPLKHYVYMNFNSKPEIKLIMNEKRDFLYAKYMEIKEKCKMIVQKTKYNRKDYKTPQELVHDDKRYFKQLIQFMSEKEKLPAVVFIFSRAKCDNIAQLVSEMDLTSKSEKFFIEKFFDRSIGSLKEEDQCLPQIRLMRILLRNGIGIHHSGILPILKEIVEICFQNGWTKILFATETFAMGVNMPTRTVLFNSVKKFDGRGTRFLKPAEYIQMAGRAGRRGLDEVGTVCILLKDKLPDVLDLKLIMTKNAESLTSQFKITYRMLLNVLRVERLNLEEIISHSFRENFNLKSQSKMKSEIEKTEEILSKKDGKSINLQVYEICRLGYQMIEEHNLFWTNVVSRIRRFLCPGRVLLIGHNTDLKFAFLLEVFYSQSAMKLIVLVPMNDSSNISNIERTLINMNDSLSFNKLSKLCQIVRFNIFKPEGCEKSRFLVIDPCDIYEITNRVEKLNINIILKDYRLGNRKLSADTVIALKKLREISLCLNSVEYLHMQRDCKVKLLDLMEQYYKYINLKNSFMSVRQKISFSDDEFLNVLLRVTNEEKLSDLKLKHSQESNITYIESDLKKDVLRALKYINDQDRLTLKGRVACQISTNELIITELVLQGILVELKPTEVAAALSALIFEAKTEVTNISLLNDDLKKALVAIQTIYDEIKQAEHRFGVRREDSDRLEELNIGLVYVVYKWAESCPFSEIMTYTDVQEGIIVRCIQQLHEILQDVREAAKLIGDSILQAKMEEVSLLIKRDIVFSISLYTQ